MLCTFRQISRLARGAALSTQRSKPLRNLRRREANSEVEKMQAPVDMTLLEAAQEHGINMSGACNGTLECSTCHCVLEKEDYAKLKPPSETERDLLESAWGLQPTSRLSCQVKLSDLREGSQVSFPTTFPGELPAKSSKPDNFSADLKRPTFPANYAGRSIEKKEYKLVTKRAIPRVLGERLPGQDTTDFLAVASVLPFRANNYVIEELIDWNNVPKDPIFQLTFPQRGMLAPEHLEKMSGLLRVGAKNAELRDAANAIRKELNPHPAKQQEMNIPSADGAMLPGMQHKYRETTLFFASEGQYCHAYCTYCFRWAQFVGAESLQFSNNDHLALANYIRNTPHVTDVLLTGGDPMVMKSFQLARYIEPLLEIPTLKNIRIGSKSLAYWPYRYLTDDDAEDTLRLFERVAEAGKHLSFQAHFSNPQELQTDAVQEAIRRIRMTGAQIRCQAPLIKHVNDDADTWTEMWTKQVQLGMVPYYMFVERDTGPRRYFEVPLGRAYKIYSDAVSRVGGLGRTVRGPSMSCTPGKCHVVGTAEIRGEKVFVLKFLQARNPEWGETVFFAKYDPEATWLDNLTPAFGEEKFFFEDELARMEMVATGGGGSSGQILHTV